MVTNTEVYNERVRNVLKEHNINGSAKKNLLQANRPQRFSFDLANKNKSFDFWKTVVFSEESK